MMEPQGFVLNAGWLGGELEAFLNLAQGECNGFNTICRDNKAYVEGAQHTLVEQAIHVC
jgi:hypothetical protein